MDISICFADFPTESIGDTTRDYRQLGIGYANLGALLMAMGLGYDSDGGRYFDGRQALRRIGKDGADVSWPLPADAIGSWEHPRLIEAEGRLFLFNEPGRVLRIKRNAASESQPFALDATFVKNIPNVDQPKRIWLDPAGRIIIAHDGNTLTILFPSGRIPSSIAQRMLASDLKANEPE
jgi:hypothetical protein